jgi:hypothetical protein
MPYITLKVTESEKAFFIAACESVDRSQTASVKRALRNAKLLPEEDQK